MMTFDARFDGNTKLYGEDIHTFIKQKSVTIIGLGGVGSWAAEALARIGISNMTLIDLDEICLSNTNRQIHTLTSVAGNSKIEVMHKRLLDINPEIKIKCVHDFISKENTCKYLQCSTGIVNTDGIIDAIDGVSAKAALIAFSVLHKISIVTTGGAAGKMHPWKIQINDLAKSFNDPLLQRVRKKLRQEYDFPKDKRKLFQVDAIFSPEDTNHTKADTACEGTTTNQEQKFPPSQNPLTLDHDFTSDILPLCQSQGTSIFVPATMGLWAAYRLIEKWRLMAINSTSNATL